MPSVCFWRMTVTCANPSRFIGNPNQKHQSISLGPVTAGDLGDSKISSVRNDDTNIMKQRFYNVEKTSILWGKEERRSIILVQRATCEISVIISVRT